MVILHEILGRVSKIFIGNLDIELHRIRKCAWRDSCNFKNLEHKIEQIFENTWYNYKTK